MTTRRRFFELSLIGAAAPWLLGSSGEEKMSSMEKTLKAHRLKKGDHVMLVSPAFAAFNKESVAIKKESLESWGLKVSLAPHLFDRYGYLAGSDEDRAADLNAAFANPDIKAVISHSGGWGCARLLPLLDYDVIRRNPKILLGFSDNTSLLLAVYSQTGLITFHGPSPRNKVCADYTHRLIFDGEKMLMRNPVSNAENLAPTLHRTRTMTSGKTTGPLIGGNLTVLTSIVGTPYLPDFTGAVLFIEDVEEQVYRIDRMITQLKLAGILEQIKGFIFGVCRKCGPGERHGSLTLQDVLDEHVKPLGIPAFQGMMVGHIKEQFTLPIGCRVTMDADQGTIQLLESPVL